MIYILYGVSYKSKPHMLRDLLDLTTVGFWVDFLGHEPNNFHFFTTTRTILIVSLLLFDPPGVAVRASALRPESLLYLGIFTLTR